MDAVCEHVGYLSPGLKERVAQEPTREKKLRIVRCALQKRRAESYRMNSYNTKVWDNQMKYYYSLAESELSVR